MVVAKARDPFEARDMLLKYEPDLMTCDVEMPKMNGIEFIRRLLPQHFIPVIDVSGVTDAVFEAMDAGAVDFVAKPKDCFPRSFRECSQKDWISKYLCTLKKLRTMNGLKLEKC